MKSIMNQALIPQIVICVAYFVDIVRSESESLLIKTSIGKIRGITIDDKSGLKVDAFLSIPYAEPPLGQLRFKHPKPKEEWDDILDTVSMPKSCPVTVQNIARHVPFLKKQLPSTPFDEDCLKLNIWVPNPRPNRPMPVMIYLHGGGFSFGSSTVPTVSGETLAARENVIVANLNYRLASLGFMFLNHSEVPGNAGLYDQVLAIKWIKDNALVFGGDPDQITLMGESAGAISAAIFAFNDLTRPLFNRLILMSPVLRSWVLMSRKESLEKSYEMLNNLGCPVDRQNVKASFDCLLQQTPDELLESEPVEGYSSLVFKPIIDDLLIKELPEKALQSGKIKTCDLLIGSNKDEGTLFLILNSPHVFQVTKDVVKPGYNDYLEMLENFFKDRGIADESLLKIIDFQYTNWLDLDNPEKMMNAFSNTITDYFFSCAPNTMSNVFSEAGEKVFRYYYTHPAPSSYSPKWMGAFHGAQNHYVFGDVFNFEPKLPETEINFSKRIMRYYANFARTGDPNIGIDGVIETSFEWPRYDVESRKYFILSPNSSNYGTKFKEENCVFWDKFLPKLGLKTSN